MATFVYFRESHSGTPVAINPEHVCKVCPAADDPESMTIIRLDDGEEVGVEGLHSEIIDMLRDA